MRKHTVLVLSIMAVFLISALVVGCGSKEAEKPAAPAYPTKAINCLIGFAAGGPGDVIGRGILPILQEKLGKGISISNQPGASGATAGAEALKGKDGYTMLFGTETLSVWQIMDLLNASPTKDFKVIKIVASATPVLAVPPDSQFDDMKSFIEYAKANPEKLRIGTAGPATVPHVSGLLLTKTLGAKFTFVPFQGGKPAVTAVMGGQVDATIEMVNSMSEAYKAKQLKVLATFTNEPVKGLEDVPQAGKIYPELAPQLPYGPYFGLFVSKDTPDDVVKILTAKMDEAVKDPRWAEYQNKLYIVPADISGQAAVDYLNKWTSNTAWTLYDMGVAKKSPADFGIPKP